MYSRHSVEVVSGQRRRQFFGIKPGMGCDSGPTLNRNWLGSPTSCLRDTEQHDSLQVMTGCWSAPAMVMGGTHVEDIF